MSKQQHKNKDMFNRVCSYIGLDHESEPCQELKQHLNHCPNCRIYVDKIKKTVEIYRKANSCDEMPRNVSDKLFVKLDLKKPDSKQSSDNQKSATQ